MNAPRTALVLSGGASLGAIQAGMLRALIDEGIRPGLIVGGSVIAPATSSARAFLAGTPSPVAPLRPAG